MATKTLEDNRTLPNVTLEIRGLVDEIDELVRVTKRAEEKEAAAKHLLKAKVKPIYWKDNQGEYDPTHIYDVSGRKAIAQLNFVDKYHLNEERFEKLNDLLQEATSDFFKKTYNIRVSALEVKKYNELTFLLELQKLCDKFGAEAVVEDVHVVKPCFHTDRHQLIPALNERIDKILPMEVQVTI